MRDRQIPTEMPPPDNYTSNFRATDCYCTNKRMHLLIGVVGSIMKLGLYIAVLGTSKTKPRYIGQKNQK